MTASNSSRFVGRQAGCPQPRSRTGRAGLVRVLMAALCVPLAAVAQTEGAAPSAVAVPAGLSPDYKLAWSDEFNGDALNQGEWGFRTDSKHLSTQKPENVSVKSGLLCLTLKKEAAGGKQYTGAGIISKATYKYGYFEARMKMPPGAGWHTSFWLMKHDGSGTTDSQDAAQGIVVTQNESVDHLSYAVKVEKYQEPVACYGFLRMLGPDLSADFHVYGCEFTPASAKFYFDGKLVQSVDVSHMAHSEQNLWLTSIASHMGNTPKVDEGALPQDAQCDYVRVFVKTNGATTAR